MSHNGVDALLERLCGGDTSAASLVFREYETILRRAVRRRMPVQIRGRFDSTDVVQSAWRSILAGFRDGRWQFRDAEHFQAFLTRVVLFRLYDRSRTALNQTKREELFDERGRAKFSGESRPSEVAMAEEIWHQLLAVCPPEHLAVLHDRRSGLSCQEIASRSGLHAGSVRRILRLLARRVAFKEPRAVLMQRVIP